MAESNPLAIRIFRDLLREEFIEAFPPDTIRRDFEEHEKDWRDAANRQSYQSPA